MARLGAGDGPHLHPEVVRRPHPGVEDVRVAERGEEGVALEAQKAVQPLRMALNDPSESSSESRYELNLGAIFRMSDSLVVVPLSWVSPNRLYDWG